MPPAASVATAIKKGEGEPLTRYDIQYCLLDKIFSNSQKVFTVKRKDGSESKSTFGDLYVSDFMSSNKLTKNLREKFVQDASVTRKVCMASVVVNTGRINTTLVFTPTQARTYNPIPCIQAYGNGSKVLQDAPRLKGILKGSCEKAASDWEALRSLQRANASAPIVNPIQLIFLLTSPATNLDVKHFETPNFMPHEVLSDTRYTSDSRAKVWLWLMYFYIETNGTPEAQENNPFGPGLGGVLAPALEPSTDEASRAENAETPFEHEYSLRMWEERAKYMATVQQKNSEQPVKTEDGKQTEIDDAEEPATRRSSRKIKKRIYDSGPDSGEDGPADMHLSEDYKSLRSQQILRHKLHRSRRETWKRRRLGKDGELESAMTREYRLSVLNAAQKDDDEEVDEYAVGGVDDEGWLWDDQDGEEAYHYAKLIRRAERRSREPKRKKKKERPSSSAAGGGFKIKLKF